MIRNPTPEQRAVIQSELSQMMVTASAGAGKTYVLVERYLWLIRERGLRPHQILAITFTKKAAAEMKLRIVSRLRDMGLQDHAQEAETGPIQTIHSFCERLLRENSLEAGLDPDFEVMGDSEQTQLRDACVQRALGAIDETQPEAYGLLQFLAGQRDYGAISPYARLEGSVDSVLRGLRGTPVRLSDLRELSNPAALMASFEAKLIAELPPPVQSALKDTEACQPLPDRIKAAHKVAGLKSPPYLAGKFDPEAETQSARHAAGLLQIAGGAWAEMEVEMVRNQSLDYASLESRAVDLIQGSLATRNRISTQYAAMMVDEAQDVNPVQYQLLEALGIETAMYVGDHQQSIYGFRQADIELFHKKTRDLAALRLSRNWRSDEGILNFVDDLFAQLWSGEYKPMLIRPDWDPDEVQLPTYPGIEVWEMPAKDIAQTAKFLVEMVGDSGLARRDVTILVRNARFANELQQRLQAMQVRSQIVGGTEKFYVRLEIRDLANLLTCLGNPFNDFALLATLRSPIMGISMDSIAMLALDSPVSEALRTFVPPNESDAGPLNQFRSWFLPLSQYADRLPAWEVLSQVFAKSPLMPALARRKGGERMLANVRKLLTLASQEPELGPVEFAEQIREIQRLAHKEGDAPVDDQEEDAFTIMTIHKAKGLEFEAVVLADVHSRPGAKAAPVEVDARIGLIATKFGRSDSLVHKWLSHRRKERELEEEMRVLYVAMTRAKSRLAVTAHPTPRNPGSIAGKIAKAMNLGGKMPLGVVKRTPSSEGAD
ncbi:MAG: UvrD-helicase domain-containing protein [Fimbriimonadaceae bacterium]|nr:UvrD-helicase domain-containing protein [Fimbriimonadaceae bacterium]